MFRTCPFGDKELNIFDDDERNPNPHLDLYINIYPQSVLYPTIF